VPAPSGSCLDGSPNVWEDWQWVRRRLKAKPGEDHQIDPTRKTAEGGYSVSDNDDAYPRPDGSVEQTRAVDLAASRAGQEP